MRGVIFSIITLLSLFSFGQAEEFTKWSSSSQSIEGEEFEITISVELAKTWHTYSQFTEDFGPMATVLTFHTGEDFELVGVAEESETTTYFDDIFGVNVTQFDGKAVYTQKIKRLNPEVTSISGDVMYQICTDVDGKCIGPVYYDFTIDLEGGKEVIQEVVHKTDSATLAVIPTIPNLNLKAPINPDCGDVGTTNQSYWMLFAFGLIFGFLSLFTPCVFPMIPLTVSFFTKGGSESRKGIAKAILYGASIVAVYVSLSLPFYASGTDPEVLNEISTSFTLNIIFFAIFIFFAFSFFGYYEIALPASWANKADKAADKGGVIGVIFMALVLAIVSFSCTGPLLGAVLGESLSKGPVPITFAMLGFGLGLGLPFSVFAMFPSLLKKMPQSGGWLNTVKVVLGFIELAFALKFMSNADYVYQFHFIERETFFLIWLILALATSLYLFGLFRFPHDSKIDKLSTPRKVFAAAFLAFAIYLAPGVLPTSQQFWKTSMVAGFPPATNYSWYDQGDHHFLDFEEAEDYAQEVQRPILIDFTGYACVNCRKMEENVWTDEKVKKLLDQYVIVSLYVDDKNELPKEQQGEVPIELYDGTKKQKKIITIGNKWATFESLRFKQISQPYYVLLSPDGYLLTNPIGFTPDVDAYVEWLECGLNAFEKLQNGNFSNDELEEIEATSDEPVKMEEVVAAKWSYHVTPLENNEFEIKTVADLAEGYHIYSQYMDLIEGPSTTFFQYDENPSIELVGKSLEPDMYVEYDEVWKADISQFSGTATFIQKIKVNGDLPQTVSGTILYQACNDGQCVMLDETFSIELK